MAKHSIEGTTRYGANTVRYVSHLVSLVNDYCQGCPSCIPVKGSFVRCKQGVVTSNLAPAGTILASEIVAPAGCLARK
jgi:hypothetical protein